MNSYVYIVNTFFFENTFRKNTGKLNTNTSLGFPIEQNSD